MKSVPKLIRRFAGILAVSLFLFLVLNVTLLVSWSLAYSSSGGTWSTAQEAADAMSRTESGYILSDSMQNELTERNIWALYIDNTSLEILWHSDNLPEDIPLAYTASDISGLTRGYVNDYPTFTGQGTDGLMVLGYPKQSYWKHMYPSWDLQMIADAPKTVGIVLGANLILLFLIYIGANMGVLRSVRPIAEGIQKLPLEEHVTLKETGVLSELAKNINRTSEILQSQKYQILKKDAARANWIAGVSHDIRTPLSMVMGYAGQLEQSQGISPEDKKKVSVILSQSRRIKNLINDLNLASKLEYNMQPLSMKPENAVAVVRQVAVDFINNDIEGKYPVEWETDENLSVCMVQADRELLKRAVSNLIQNSMNHNEDGCTIYVSVSRAEEKKSCVIRVEDDGAGVSPEQLERLERAPHYMMCDTNTGEQRHGLGLMIVKQIAASHGGRAEIGRGRHGGFGVSVILPAI